MSIENKLVPVEGLGCAFGALVAECHQGDAAISELANADGNLFDMETVFGNNENITKDAMGYYVGTVNAFRNAVAAATFSLDPTKHYSLTLTGYCEGASENTSIGLYMQLRDANDTNVSARFALLLKDHSPVTKAGSTTQLGAAKLYLGYSSTNSYKWHLKDIVLVEGKDVPIRTAKDSVARARIEALEARLDALILENSGN